MDGSISAINGVELCVRKVQNLSVLNRDAFGDVGGRVTQGRDVRQLAIKGGSTRPNSRAKREFGINAARGPDVTE